MIGCNDSLATRCWMRAFLAIHWSLTLEPDECKITFSGAHSFPVVFFFFFTSFLSTAQSRTCAETQIFLSCLFTWPPAYTSLSIPLFIPHPALIHIVYSSLKTHPVSCKLLVPLLSLILSPSPSLLSSASRPRMFG